MSPFYIGARVRNLLEGAKAEAGGIQIGEVGTVTEYAGDDGFVVEFDGDLYPRTREAHELDHE